MWDVCRSTRSTFEGDRGLSSFLISFLLLALGCVALFLYFSCPIVMSCPTKDPRQQEQLIGSKSLSNGEPAQILFSLQTDCFLYLFWCGGKACDPVTASVSLTVFVFWFASLKGCECMKPCVSTQTETACECPTKRWRMRPCLAQYISFVDLLVHGCAFYLPTSKQVVY